MKIAFFHPKRLKIWNRFENIVPLQCQNNEAGETAFKDKNCEI